jgi:diguanylate cyclase (GGDEF)-like protein/PAS domain S-box-containing protein
VRPAGAGEDEGERLWLLGACTLVAYLAAALWAKEISLPGPVLIWFPPAGIAIAATYLRPRLVVVVAVAEAISTSGIMGLGHEYGLLPLAVNSTGLALAYGLGGWLLRRFALDPRLRSAEDIAVLGLGIAGSSAVASVLGIAVQRWIGLVPSSDVARSIGVFWVGDLVGAACIVPTAVVLGRGLLDHALPPLADEEGTTPRWRVLVALVAPAVVAIALMGVGERPMRFVYLAFVPVIVVAVRHGVTAACLSTAVLSAVMTAGAHIQLDSALERSDFQLLLLVLTLTGITTGAVVSARRDIMRAKDRVSAIVEATPDLVASASRDGSIRYLNPVGRRLLGFGPQALPTTRAFDFLPDQMAQDLMREGMRTAEREGSWTGQNRIRRPDGHVFPVSQVLISHPQPDDDGQHLYSTIIRDTSSQQAMEDQLRRAAFYDEATGLPNRALLVEQLARAVSAADAARRVAILFTDIDHLQRVNEAFGFTAGEEVIRQVATCITEVVRAQDLVARHGGSQFVVVLTDLPDELEAVTLADRLLACFAEPIEADGHELHVTGSVGITLVEPGQDHLEALRAAEIALHRAKEAGGGRFALFDAELERRAQRRREIEDDLHEVLTTASWTLAYQPIFDSALRTVVGVEALLRWTHPTRGPVAPFEIVRLAEASGTIVALGREIFRRACHEAQRWHAMGFDLPVSINVSARQLREPEFVADVRAVIEEVGIDPQRVVIELTETVLATHEHGEIATLHALRNLGCQIALDDFGTGYSSLAGLSELPIDVIKLDQTFITGLTRSPKAAALVAAVVGLADAFELVVVAEGVEEDAQIDALAALGCHRIQGFALSRPVGPDVITGMLADLHPTGAAGNR